MRRDIGWPEFNREAAHHAFEAVEMKDCAKRTDERALHGLSTGRT